METTSRASINGACQSTLNTVVTVFLVPEDPSDHFAAMATFSNWNIPDNWDYEMCILDSVKMIRDGTGFDTLHVEYNWRLQRLTAGSARAAYRVYDRKQRMRGRKPLDLMTWIMRTEEFLQTLFCRLDRKQHFSETSASLKMSLASL